MTKLNGNYTDYISRVNRNLPDGFYNLPMPEQDDRFHISVKEFRGSDHRNIVDIKSVTIGDCEFVLFLPRNKTDCGAGVFYIHGGGFLFGSTNVAHELCIDFAFHLNVPVILPRYPVGTNSTFPETNKRILHLYATFQTKSADYGVDADQIVFGGESCGGYFASTLSFDIRDQGLVPFASQLLVNPILDLTRWTYFIEGGGVDHFCREMMQFTSHYCNGQKLENVRTPMQ